MAFELSLPRTAIVTGGARRIGEAIVRLLASEGWTVLIHCHQSRSQAEQLAAEIGNARIAVCDLARGDACMPIREALAGMPPVGLLVNNASRFVHDDFDDFSLEGWAAHFDVNLRAPALLSRMFAELATEGGLIVNIHDAKLAFPNPDFFTYTLSKIGLAGLTELSARKLAARKIRVCGIAPSVTMVSGPQSRRNFDAVHAMNALGRGVVVEDIVRALRFIVDTPTLTGQTIVLDGGQRFLGLPRDVQFMGDE
jgi:Dehydrogenases with different specificities (related to short-chain alcohol dehydrogenases)